MMKTKLGKEKKGGDAWNNMGKGKGKESRETFEAMKEYAEALEKMPKFSLSILHFVFTLIFAIGAFFFGGHFHSTSNCEGPGNGKEL